VEVGCQAELQSAISIVGKQDGMALSLKGAAQQVGGVRSVFSYQDSDVFDLALCMLISDDDTAKFVSPGRFLRLSSDWLAVMPFHPFQLRKTGGRLCAGS
jgi:hypothetical protein